MTPLVITEEKSDILLLKQVFNGEDKVRYYDAGSWSSADSLARSYLTDSDTKVALVVDADTADPNLIEERKRFLTRSLGQIADARRFKIIVVAPEIESWLFKRRETLEELVGHPVTDTEFTQGQYEPKKVLLSISNEGRMRLFGRLDQINLDFIRALPEVVAMKEFLGLSRAKIAA